MILVVQGEVQFVELCISGEQGTEVSYKTGSTGIVRVEVGVLSQRARFVNEERESVRPG